MVPSQPVPTGDTGVIRAASLRGFVPLVEDLGGDPFALLGRFGIPAAALSRDDGLIPITAHDSMLDTAADELACPDLGLRLAEGQDLSILGPLAVAIESSSSVSQALSLAAKFLFVHSPALHIGVEADPRGTRGVVAVTYRKSLRESPYSPQATERGIALLHRSSATLLGDTTGLRSVELPHAPLSPVARYTDHFGVDVRFDGAVAALRVDQHVLDATFAHADAAIRAIALEHLTRHHTDPQEQVAVRVRRTLGEGLGSARTSLEHVARVLGMHPRTLQRQLAAEETSFDVVLDDVRRTVALHYITGTDIPFVQVAALVGLSEQSALSRSVRRWSGLSPRELRRRSHEDHENCRPESSTAGVHRPSWGGSPLPSSPGGRQ